MRFAYADPPYPGQAHQYRGHPDYAGEVDHAKLIGQLCQDYPDGWALSTHGKGLQSCLGLCPSDVQVAIWHNTNSQPPGARPDRWWRVWEAVIVRGGRPGGHIVKNLLVCSAINGGNLSPEARGPQIVGRKPAAFTRWITSLLGATPDDTIDDLFPGSGAVGRELTVYAAQPQLVEFPAQEPAGRGSGGLGARNE